MMKRRRKTVWLFAFLCLLLLSLWGCGKKDEAAGYIEQGMEALAGGDPAGAKEILAKAEEQAPEDAGVLRALGIVFYQEGDYPQAVSYFSNALLALGDDGEPGVREDILRYKADAEAAAADYGAAVSDYDQLIAMNKEPAEYYLLRGRAFLELGDVERAVSDFRAAISASADNLDYCEDIYQDLKEHGAAAAGLEFLEVIRRAGAADAGGDRYGRACLELARVQMEDGQYEEALLAAQEGLSQAAEPARKELLYVEGACYERLLDFETALEKFRAWRDAYGGNETVDHEIAFLVTRVELPESDASERTDVKIQVETGPTDASVEVENGPETAADEGL